MQRQLKHPLLRTQFPKIRDLGPTVKRRFLVDGRINGWGKREYFQRIGEARTRADQIATEKDNRGAEALSFSTEDRVMAVDCTERLRPFGKTLREATDHYVAWLKEQAQRKESPLVSEVVAQYLDQRKRDFERGDLAELSFFEIRHRARRLAADLGGLRITELDGPKVKTYVDSFPVSARTRANIRLRLSKLFSFCIERGWINQNPCASLKVRVPRHDVSILSVTEAERLLRAAERSEHREFVVPYAAISLFAGCRPFEVQRLDWSQVDFKTKTIHVKAATSKRRETRFTHLQPNLIQWLRPFAKKNGLVVGSNFRKKWESITRAAGYDPTSKSKRWRTDVMRHTAASMLLALTSNRALVAEELGTSVEVIRTFYRQPILKADAKRYFSLVRGA
jgi:integrase